MAWMCKSKKNKPGSLPSDLDQTASPTTDGDIKKKSSIFSSSSSSGKPAEDKPKLIHSAKSFMSPPKKGKVEFDNNEAWEDSPGSGFQIVGDNDKKHSRSSSSTVVVAQKRPSPTSIVTGDQSSQNSGGADGDEEGKKKSMFRRMSGAFGGGNKKEGGEEGGGAGSKASSFFGGQSSKEGKELSDLHKFKHISTGYQGDTDQDGNPDGNGIYKYPDGSIYKGQWRTGLRHGHGTYTYVNGDKYKGEWDGGYKGGDGVMKWHNGDVFSGEWKFNKREGLGKFTGHDGRSYHGYYHDDCKHGAGIYKWPNGDIYDGNWKFNQKHRSGTIRYHNYDVFQGEFEDDMKSGPGTWFFNIGKQFKDHHAFPYDWTLNVVKIELFDLIHTEFITTLHASKKNSMVKNDPYVWLNIGRGARGIVAAGHVLTRHPYKTSAKEGQDKPVWDENDLKGACVFDIEDYHFEKGIDIKVYDFNMARRDVLIGEANLNLHKIESRIGDIVEFSVYLKDTHLSGASDQVRTSGRAKISVQVTPYILHDLTNIETYSGSYQHNLEVGKGTFTFKDKTTASLVFDESGTVVSCCKYTEPVESMLGIAGADTGVSVPYSGVAAYASGAPSSESTLLHHLLVGQHDYTDLVGTHKNVHTKMNEAGIKTDPEYTPDKMNKYLSELKTNLNSVSSAVLHTKQKLGYEPDHLAFNSGVKTIVTKEGAIISMMHGRGKYRYPGGDFYEGDYVDNKRHGYGTYIYLNKDTYSGGWEHDYRHGFGNISFTNGDKYEGQWRANKRHGRGKTTYRDGHVFEGFFRDDRRCGYGIMKYPNGDVYAGHWKSNMKNRFGVFKYANGDVYIGDFKYNKRHGHGKFVKYYEPTYQLLPPTSTLYTSKDIAPGYLTANLGREGSEGYFSGMGVDQTIVKISVKPAQKLHRYNIITGSNTSRYPKAWEMWGLVKDGKKLELLHKVDNERFMKEESKSFVLELLDKDALYSVLEFRCIAVNTRGAGLHVKGLTFDYLISGEYYEGDFEDDLPNGHGVYQDAEGMIHHGLFENGDFYKEDDAKCCGDGGLFDPAAMIASLTEVPTLDEFGIDTPAFCTSAVACVSDVINHFNETLNEIDYGSLAVQNHPRRVVSHPNNTPATSSADRWDLDNRGSPRSDIGNAVVGPPTANVKNLKIVPRAAKKAEPVDSVPGMMMATSEGMHVQNAPGANKQLFISAAAADKALESLSSLTSAPTAAEMEKTARRAEDAENQINELAAGGDGSRVKEGEVIINDETGEAYYIEHGLRRALSPPDEDGYRHDAADDEVDLYCDFLAVMLNMRAPRPKYYIRGTVIWPESSTTSKLLQQAEDLAEDLGGEGGVGSGSEGAANDNAATSRAPAPSTPLKTFGSLTAFSKSQKAKDTKVSLFSSLSGSIEEAPPPAARAASANAPPSTPKTNLPRTGLLGKFNASKIQAQSPAPPKNNKHILHVERNFSESSNYVPEPTGVVVGSSTERAASRQEVQGQFDWTFGFGGSSGGEETKTEPGLDSQSQTDQSPSGSISIEVKPQTMMMASSSGSDSASAAPIASSSSSAPPPTRSSQPAVSPTAITNDDLVDPTHSGQLPHHARVVVDGKGHSAPTVNKTSSPAPAKKGGMFTKKKEGTMASGSNYKPMKDGGNGGGKSMDKNKDEKRSQIPAWLSWLPQCN